jgi:hypothetical protein
MSLLLPLILATSVTSNVRLVPFFPDREFPAKGEEVVVRFDNIDPGIPFDEVVPSWNVTPADGASLRVQIRSHGDGFDSKWYSFGKWTLDDASARTSVEGQKDEQGNVSTDTFIPRKAAKTVDVQLTLRNDGDGPRPRLKLLTLSFANSKAISASEKNPSPAWGKTIEVPQRAQGNYPNGGVLCSPTSLSMVLWHYANQLHRPELNKDVPEIVACVWDKTYDGAGNWPFNAAYAGSFPGMRSYITRFRNIGDLERWIDAGLPVICSISLNIARGMPQDGGSGHLVVLVGFTKDGDPVFNDPARRAQVRYTYKRENFEKAWLHSNRTVYIVHPEDAVVPADPDGVWIAK